MHETRWNLWEVAGAARPEISQSEDRICFFEDLCFMLRNMGFATGVDIEKLIAVSHWTEQFFNSPLPGQVMKAGLFPEVVNLKAGDVLVQRGTVHNWTNPGTEPCIVAFILMSAPLPQNLAAEG